ncbi:hypothetical protein [Aurantiacibacter flavus]|uniref:Uncharacterized protein n=1 Tax=Aurantiacibacter flavus TaxID=3145232 RepID=A0ABV0CZ49_9SPHN
MPHIDYLDVRSDGALTVEVTANGVIGTYDSYDAAQLAGDYDAVPEPAYRVEMHLQGREEAMAPRFVGKVPFPFSLSA